MRNDRKRLDERLSVVPAARTLRFGQAKALRFFRQHVKSCHCHHGRSRSACGGGHRRTKVIRSWQQASVELLPGSAMAKRTQAHLTQCDSVHPSASWNFCLARPRSKKPTVGQAQTTESQDKDMPVGRNIFLSAAF